MKKILILLIVFVVPSVVFAQNTVADNLSSDIGNTMTKTLNPADPSIDKEPNIGALVDTSVGKTVPQSKFNENYFVGLSAYEDGLYDVARISLEDFLMGDSNSEQAMFATYILYQTYLKEGNYTAAKDKLDIVKMYDDERFDMDRIKNDEMYIVSKMSCEDAVTLMVNSPIDSALIKSYVYAGCSITPDVGEFVARNKFSADTTMYVINQAKDKDDTLVRIFQNLTPEKRTPEVLNFYGHYFALTKNSKEFWTLYNEYKDPEIVSLALEDIWAKNDFLRYYDLFTTDVKADYKLSSTAYCRMIESANKTGNSFNCDYVDGCLGVTNVDFNKTKLACYMKNSDTKGITSFMATISEKEASTNLCEYGKYVVSEKLYDKSYLNKFSSCSDRRAIYDLLVQHEDWEAIEALAGTQAKAELDSAFLSIAAYKLGKVTVSRGYLAEVSSPTLIDLVQMYTGAN